MSAPSLKRKASLSPDTAAFIAKLPRLRSPIIDPIYQPSKGIQLLDLPSELLLDVFHFAREPCMIHKCKALHELLPNFVQYTKRLVRLAFGSADVLAKDDDPWTLPETPHDRQPRREDCSDQLQLSVASSHWLRASHLKETHVALFNRLLQTHLIENPELERLEMPREEVLKLDRQLGSGFSEIATLSAMRRSADPDGEDVEVSVTIND